MANIFSLYSDLKDKKYNHGVYKQFKINDPKPRDIHKATVRDRLLHHAIYRILYPFFDRKFIPDSYSCRLKKGQHKAIRKFQEYYSQVSKNKTKIVWVLKCDIRKCFASVDQATLFQILKKSIKDVELLLLLRNIIKSFSSTNIGKGLPLGNLTSQLLINIYLNELDQFVKHKLKIKHYIRYADDFVFMSRGKDELENILPKIKEFLYEKLKLELHPNKVFIKTFSSGVDFLGWIHFPYHRVLRTSTKWRMFRKLEEDQKEAVVFSYWGMLRHGNGFKLAQKVKILYDSKHDKPKNTYNQTK